MCQTPLMGPVSLPLLVWDEARGGARETPNSQHSASVGSLQVKTRYEYEYCCIEEALSRALLGGALADARAVPTLTLESCHNQHMHTHTRRLSLSLVSSVISESQSQSQERGESQSQEDRREERECNFSTLYESRTSQI